MKLELFTDHNHTTKSRGKFWFTECEKLVQRIQYNDSVDWTEL